MIPNIQGTKTHGTYSIEDNIIVMNTVKLCFEIKYENIFK